MDKIFLTPRCRTLKVPKVGTFSPWLENNNFWGFEIYTQKCMNLRDFDTFLFFPWILWFLRASLNATFFANKACKRKWSCFSINERFFVNLRTFCVKNIIFHNFYILFPDSYIYKTISYSIFMVFMFFPNWYIHMSKASHWCSKMFIMVRMHLDRWTSKIEFHDF